ncbi:hypothetical protein ACEPAH_2220 [Sanghuangporus vaninii]
MKNTFTDRHLPRASNGRRIALGVCAGEVSNRIITVGFPSRTEAIAHVLDQVVHSEYHGAMVRECVNKDLVIVRLGSSGGLTDLSYPELHDFLADKLKNAEPWRLPSYSSQDRNPGFLDHNKTLINDLIQKTPGFAILEMKTFYLFHLVSSWRRRRHESGLGSPTAPLASFSISPSAIPPLGGVMPEAGCSRDINTGQATGIPTSCTHKPGLRSSPSHIRAAVVQIILAQLRCQNIISPTEVASLEVWAG